MTFLAVSIAAPSAARLESLLLRATKSVEAGARLIEWRIDALAEQPDATAAVETLVRRSPAPCIVTCRSFREGGEWRGDEAERARLLAALVRGDDPPRYIDVELNAFRRSGRLRREIEAALDEGRRTHDVHTSLILSVHDLERRPADLLQKIETMTVEPACAVIKVAWRARSLRDNLEVFDLLAERRKPTIALCLGRFGLPSRVLAPKFGGLLTYATDQPGAQTAPGQPTVDELRRVFGFERIGAETAVFGVIGWPVEHSLGPVIHNAGFKAVGHAGVYLPLPVPSEYEHFKATVGALVDHPRLDFRGASVTSPHKESLLRFVRERGGRVDESAGRAGAANTLAVEGDGSIECRNTDGAAALAALGKRIGVEPTALAGRRIAVLGAGGMARAVVAVFSHAGAEIILLNRTKARAEALAGEFNGRPTASGEPARVAVGKPEVLGGRLDAVINCTPIGMAGGPAPGKAPWPKLPLDDRVVVFDVVYAPRRTPLIEQAEARGAPTICGLDLFFRQAALQFERWTGRKAPMEVFERSIGSGEEEEGVSH
ncbi:MAG: type I 3-dehydroquinate dehydratase [Planctomycetota bacterium]